MHLPRRACLMLTVLLFSVTFIRFVPAQEKTATTIEFRKLKALLPDSFGKFERTSSSGERSSAFGISVSYAEATYGNDDGGQITIKLTDMGGMPGISAMASGAWASVEMERETDTGFERTTEYKGYKVMEEYDRTERCGEISLMVGSRISIEVSGTDVDFESLRQALDALPLERIASLAANP